MALEEVIIDCFGESCLQYHIAGNIGGDLNLVDWRFYEHTTKFKSDNYFSSTNVTSSCNLVGGALRILSPQTRNMAMFRYLEREHPACPAKVPSLSEEEAIE